jgi:peptidoglycan-associated lipoprotein
MLKKIAIASFAVILLTGCAGNKKGMSSNIDTTSSADFERNVGDRVHFDFDKSHLRHDAQSTLTRQAEWLKAHSKVNVAVEGHCDDRGTREYNLALGERRAAAAAKFLESHGVAMSKIETVSFGKERPAALGTGEEVWSKNRRAVTVLK